MYDGTFRMELDFKKEGSTMNDVISFLKRKLKEDPSREYFLDGEMYAIVSKPRVA